VSKFKFPIIYYRMPDKTEVCFLQSDCNAVEIDSLDDIPLNSGFILYPFSSDSSCKPLFIHASSYSKLNLEELHGGSLRDLNWEIKDVFVSDMVSKNREEYCANVVSAVSKIQSGAIKKVVLSRVKEIKSNSFKNPLRVFYKLCMKHPAAFVSLVYIPENLVWITATPELLISADQDKIETVSLAGTKPLENMEEWGEKEKIEQQVVTDYIRNVLQKYCENISVSGPQEVIAGNVKHIKTSFSAKLNTGLWNLVSALHPTPAVCGIPLDEANQFIKQTEGYDRKYYTGFLGPCNMEGKTDLFVNLRCAEVLTDAVNLYIGGGITKDSVPEKEWEETELKSKTLLFAFEENE